MWTSIAASLFPPCFPHLLFRVAESCYADALNGALRARGKVGAAERTRQLLRAGKGKDMTFKPALLFGALLICSGIAQADGFKPPPTREGLWETHSTHTQQGKTVFDKTIKMCQSNESTQSMQARAEEMRKQNECTSNVTQPSTGTYVEESRCAKGPNAGSVTKVVYTYQGDTASHTEMRMNIGKSESAMIIDAKYVGSCPAGMKPGDLVIDGKIISGGN